MKRLVCIVLSVLCVLMLCTPFALAAQKSVQATANALYALHLFVGYGKDADGSPRFGLDDSLTREQGVLLLLRMLGKAKEAESCPYTHPFGDVSEYYDRYVAYAYHNKLTKGTAADTFSGSKPMDEKMFLTFCLRALGYQDGKNGDFLYQDVSAFAKSHGLMRTSADSFTRGDVVELFWQTLNASMKSGDKKLYQFLAAEGVFTEQEFLNASAIWVNSASSGKSSSKDENKSGSLSEYNELPPIEL